MNHLLSPASTLGLCLRAASLVLLAPLLLGAETLTPEAEGEALAAELREQQPPDQLATSGTLKMRDAAGSRREAEVTLRVAKGEESWVSSYATPGTDTLPPERLVVLHTPGKPNQYLYARATSPGGPLPQPVALASDSAATPFAGSDFWLSDLGLEFFHWPQQRLLRTEMRKGRSCRVLESLNPAPVGAGYARVLSWIDIETGGLLRAEAYGTDKKLQKEFSVRSFKKVSGRWQLKEMEIRDEKTDARTRLEFDLEVADSGAAPLSQ